MPTAVGAATASGTATSLLAAAPVTADGRVGVRGAI
jgi:hypothetical protein